MIFLTIFHLNSGILRNDIKNIQFYLRTKLPSSTTLAQIFDIVDFMAFSMQ